MLNVFQESGRKRTKKSEKEQWTVENWEEIRRKKSSSLVCCKENYGNCT